MCSRHWDLLKSCGTAAAWLPGSNGAALALRLSPLAGELAQLPLPAPLPTPLPRRVPDVGGRLSGGLVIVAPSAKAT